MWLVVGRKVLKEFVNKAHLEVVVCSQPQSRGQRRGSATRWQNRGAALEG